ncbi:MAG: hypothetical protein AB1715_00930 [Acidobacteriota bacterium]
MDDENRLDEKISQLVQSLEMRVPRAVDENIKMAASSLRSPSILSRRRRLRRLVLFPSAAALILALLFLSPFIRKRQAPAIFEIRTEFEIKDKDIKIIFIQRNDYKLFEEN